MGCTVNGFPVMSAYVSLPRVGAWSADLELATKTMTGDVAAPKVGDTVTIKVDSLTFLGSVGSLDESVYGVAKLRVWAGNGKYPQSFAASSWARPQVSVVASALLSDAGERGLSGRTSPGITAQLIPYSWISFGGDVSLSRNLTTLARKLGVAWRVEPDTGLLLLVEDTFTAKASYPINYHVVNDSSQAGSITYGASTIDSLPMPGELDEDGEHINEVVLYVHQDKTQFEVRRFQMSDLAASAPPSALGCFQCEVVSQNHDKTVDITPVDPNTTLPSSIRSVPIAVGTGATWTVSTGAKCTLAFRDNDPSQPLIVGLDGWWAGDYLTHVTYGNPTQAQFLAKGETTDANFNLLLTAATAGVNAGGVGAANFTAFKGVLTAASYPTSTQCTRVKSD